MFLASLIGLDTYHPTESVVISQASHYVYKGYCANLLPLFYVEQVGFGLIKVQIKNYFQQSNLFGLLSSFDILGFARCFNTVMKKGKIFVRVEMQSFMICGNAIE